MLKIYRLEAYDWKKDCWYTIAEFINREDAEQSQSVLEKQYTHLLFSIFTKEL